jgi:hypothetical protein
MRFFAILANKQPSEYALNKVCPCCSVPSFLPPLLLLVCFPGAGHPPAACCEGFIVHVLCRRMYSEFVWC